MLLRWISRCWPGSLFGRLAVLLLVAVLSSHLLALTLLFELHPRHNPPPPQPNHAAPPPHLYAGQRPPEVLRSEPPPMSPLSPGFLLDVGVRLTVLMLATWVGARWLTQPIRQLAQAAQELGEDIQRPPLPETGTTECREATRVFNQMQQRILVQIQERERFVAAMSHDLRTPLTRLRLRCETLESDVQRQGLVRDIAEMELLLGATLNYLRGTSTPEPMARVDLNALLQSLCDDAQDQRQDVTLAGQAAPVMAQPTALRRCLNNLVSNAVRYGNCARIQVSDTPTEALIDICDQGPGIPESELQNVLQPFYRIDTSRNPAHGGIGLGLSIANEIASRHGNPLELNNLPEGGLCVRLTLPRSASVN